MLWQQNKNQQRLSHSNFKNIQALISIAHGLKKILYAQLQDWFLYSMLSPVRIICKSRDGILPFGWFTIYFTLFGCTQQSAYSSCSLMMMTVYSRNFSTKSWNSRLVSGPQCYPTNVTEKGLLGQNVIYNGICNVI